MERKDSEIISLRLDPSENFEQALFQKIILHEKETATTYRVSLLGRPEETLGMTLSMFSRGNGKGSAPFIMVTADVPFDGWERKIPIAIVYVPSDKNPCVESYSGKGATIEDLFGDLRPGDPKDPNTLFPIEVSKILHDFCGPTERTTLEEIYGALDWDKCTLWASTISRTDKNDLAADALSKMSWPFVKEFVQSFGRPPFFSRVNSLEIETRKPLEIDLFRQKIVLFDKYPLSSGRTLRFQGAIRPNSPDEQLVFELSGGTSQSSHNGARYFCVTPGKDKTFKTSLKQICQELSLEEFSIRAELCQARDIGIEQLVFAERAIVEGASGKLGPKDLFFLAKILSETLSCTFGKERFVDSNGSVHDLVVVNLLKISQDDNGHPVRKKGKFVLSDNGDLLTGHYIIGGIDSLRLTSVKQTLGLGLLDRNER